MSVLADLARLSAAEDFFAYLDLAYDPAVLRVARLHILRRMGQYLRAESAAAAGGDEQDVRRLAQAALGRAYQDFLVSTPIQERLFKVHQDAVAEKAAAPKPFVPLTALTGTIST